MASEEMIQRFTCEVLDANSWLFVENGCGLLFDPVDSPVLYAAIGELTELLIILTHCHFDHICGLNHIRQIMPKARVLATAECSERICKPVGNLSNIANALMAFYEHKQAVEDVIGPFSCEAADWVFNDTLDIEWQGHALKLTEYNGHVQGGLCCQFDEDTLVTGDTLLFLPTVTRLPGGSTRRFWEEDIPRLRALTGSVRLVLPGHGLPGRLEDMLQVNDMELSRHSNVRKRRLV